MEKNSYFSFFRCYLFAVYLDFLSYAPATASLTSSSFATIYDERLLTLIPLPNDFNPCHIFLGQLNSLFFFSILYSFSSVKFQFLPSPPPCLKENKFASQDRLLHVTRPVASIEETEGSCLGKTFSLLLKLK